MAVFEPMDLVLRLKFDAAIQDHVAKKATNKKAKAQARQKAEDLRHYAQTIERARAAGTDTAEA